MKEVTGMKKLVVVKQPKKREDVTYDRTFFSCGCFGGSGKTTKT